MKLIEKYQAWRQRRRQRNLARSAWTQGFTVAVDALLNGVPTGNVLWLTHEQANPHFKEGVRYGVEQWLSITSGRKQGDSNES